MQTLTVWTWLHIGVKPLATQFRKWCICSHILIQHIKTSVVTSMKQRNATSVSEPTTLHAPGEYFSHWSSVDSEFWWAGSKDSSQKFYNFGKLKLQSRVEKCTVKFCQAFQVHIWALLWKNLYEFAIFYSLILIDVPLWQ